ncbi:MAG: HesA/MoeB/ThiF family protein [Polyangiaceae bacterium]|nr:HesA/MoeB/ThiF family protein [Polyangiaceae bacterium]
MTDPERPFATHSVLVVGVGGLGCPAALALVRAGVGRVVLADDDEVDITNLHRQILFEESDVGTPKLDAAHRALQRHLEGFQRVELVRSRLLPENALALLSGVDVVVEGADNFATKFLAADAAHLASVPVVHGAAIRFQGTVLAVPPGGQPCYRCLFEDVPGAEAGLNCAQAGVMGPVVGVIGALMADNALRILAQDMSVFGKIATFDGKRDRLRFVPLTPNPKCPLCGPTQSIGDVRESRYIDGLSFVTA